MNSTLRMRSLLVMLALIVLLLSLAPDQGLPAWAQSPLTPTPTATWTPFGFPPAPPPPVFTPTPTQQFRVVNEVTQPKSGDAVAGLVPIVGTALIDNYIKYEIHISRAGMEEWQWLITSLAFVRDGVLHVLNSYDYPDGFYDLRVRAVRVEGGYTEFFVRHLEIRNANPPTATPIFDALGNVQPPSPILPVSPLLPTPSPTPRYRSNLANGQGIFEPQNGDVVRGSVPVVATVNSYSGFNPFARYEVYVAAAGSNEWGWLYTGEQQYWQQQIYLWDTTRLVDGFYDLRLRVVYKDSNYDEFYVTRLRVANQTSTTALRDARELSPSGRRGPGLYFPLNDSQVNGVLELIGTTTVADCLRWELYWSPATLEEWRFLVSDTKVVENGVLARLDLSQMPAGSYDFRLRIVLRSYAYTDYYVRNVQSTPPTPTPYPQYGN